MAKLIGGCDDLYALEASGKIEPTFKRIEYYD